MEEKTKTKSLMCNRAWLNRHKSMRAHVIANVEATTYETGGGSIDASVDISDCNRNITLDLYSYYDGKTGKANFNKDHKNNLEKVRKLIAILQDVETALVEAKELIDNPG